MKKNLLGITIGLSALLGATSALAQTAMQASAKMAAICEISVPTVAFGDMVGLKINEYNHKEFSLAVKCTKETLYQITDIQDSSGLRPMIGATAGSSNSLKYEIHHKMGSAWNLFGSKTQSNSNSGYSVQGTGSGAIFQHPMRVRMVASTFLPIPDNYSANTTIEITF